MSKITIVPGSPNLDLERNHIAWDQIDVNKILIVAISSTDPTDLYVYFCIGTYRPTTENWVFSRWLPEPLYALAGVTPNSNPSHRAIDISCYKGTDGSHKLHLCLINGNAYTNHFPLLLTLELDETGNDGVTKVTITTKWNSDIFRNAAQTAQHWDNGRFVTPFRKGFVPKMGYNNPYATLFQGTNEAAYVGTLVVAGTATTDTRLNAWFTRDIDGRGNTWGLGVESLTYNLSRTRVMGYWTFTRTNTTTRNTARFVIQGSANPNYDANFMTGFVSASYGLTEIVMLGNTNAWVKLNTRHGEYSVAWDETNKCVYKLSSFEIPPIIGTVIQTYLINDTTGFFLTSEQSPVYAATRPANNGVNDDWTIKAPMHGYLFKYGTDGVLPGDHITHITYLGQIWDKASPYLCRTRMNMSSSDNQHVFIIGPLTKTEEDQSERLVYGIIDVKLSEEEE